MIPLFAEPLIEAGVKDFDDCMAWAFGDDWHTILTNRSGQVWNDRHSDLFDIYDSDDAYDAFYRIGKAYLEQQKVEVDA